MRVLLTEFFIHPLGLAREIITAKPVHFLLITRISYRILVIQECEDLHVATPVDPF